MAWGADEMPTELGFWDWGPGPSFRVQVLDWGNPLRPSCRRVDPSTGWEGGFDPNAMGGQFVHGSEMSLEDRNVGPKNVEQ